MNTENQDSKKYIVMVSDNYHFMDDEYSSKYGEYDNKDEAIKACKRIVEGSIDFVYGQTANAVYKNYCMFGEDAYIIGDASFSSRDYAKEYCNKIVEEEPTYSIDRPTAYSICSEYFRTNDYSVETDENSSKYCRDLLIEINGMKHKIHHTYYDMGRDFAEYKRHYLLGGYYENKKMLCF